MRHASHAEMVGTPVHRQRVTPGELPAEEQTERDEYSLDGPAEWVDRPTFLDQLFRGPDYWRFDHMEVKIFELSKPEDVKAYEALLTETQTPGANKVISNMERKYSEDINNWRVLLEVQHIKYRKLLKTERKE